MTLRYAKIASRTVADEYFAVTEKVEALYGQPAQLPADAIGPEDGPAAPRAPPAARQRLLHPARRSWTAPSSRSAKPAALPDQHRVPAHPADQHDHAAAHNQTGRSNYSASSSAGSIRTRHEPRQRISLHDRQRHRAMPRTPGLHHHPLPPVPLPAPRPPPAPPARPAPPILLTRLPHRRTPPAPPMSNPQTQRHPA